MEPITTFITTAAGYIIKAAAESKTAQDAKEALLGKFWNWVKPFVIKEVPQIETAPDSPATAAQTEERLLELIKNELFRNELELRLEILKQSGITMKNVVEKDIENVKRITIGDKIYNAGEQYDQKNIVKGNVRNANEFTLGDGH